MSKLVTTFLACSAIALTLVAAGLGTTGAIVASTLVVSGGLLWLPEATDSKARAELGAGLLVGSIIAVLVFWIQARTDEAKRRADLLQAQATERNARIERSAADRAAHDQRIATDRAALNFTLSSSTDLTGIDLRRRDATGAYLFGKRLLSARLSESILTGAVLAQASIGRIDATHVILDGRVNAGKSVLTHVRLRNSDLRRACFAGATFTSVILEGGDGSKMSLRGVTGSLRLTGGFTGKQVNFVGSRISLTAVGADLSGAIFTNADLDKYAFSSSRRTASSFIGGSLRNAQFGGSLIPEAQLQFGASLRGTRFDQVDLTGADFRGGRMLVKRQAQTSRVGASVWSRVMLASVRDARGTTELGNDLARSRRASPRADCFGAGRLSGADESFLPRTFIALTGADVRGADFRFAQYLDRARWRGALYDRTTMFPSGFDPAEHRMFLMLRT